MSSKLQALLVAVVSAGLGAVITYFTTRQKPDPVEVTCEVAQGVLASAACQPAVTPHAPPVEATPATAPELPPEETEAAPEKAPTT